MGYETCESCGKSDYRDEISFSCCEKGSDYAGICESCSSSSKEKQCGKCKESFCQDHGNFTMLKCCGLILCGDVDEELDGCQDDHKVTTLKGCGHQGCNFYKAKGCRMCAAKKKRESEKSVALKDVPLVEQLLKKSTCKKLQKSLSQWLALAKKQNGCVEIVDSTSSKKRKATAKTTTSKKKKTTTTKKRKTK